MSIKEIESLLIEYGQKRRDAQVDLEKRKKELYKKLPRLEEIEDEINKISIRKAKNILTNQYTNCLNTEIENKLLSLKEIDHAFFKPKYECEKCGDTGFVSFSNRKTQMCSCLKQKLINISYNKSNLSNLKKENFEKFDLNKFSNKVNVEKYKMNISPRENMKRIKSASQKFVDNFNIISAN